jgi:seryl-tRNA synthetase
MINIALLRTRKDEIAPLIKKKDPSFDIELLYTLDQRVKTLRTQIESLQKQKNECAQAGQKGVTPEIREQSIALSSEIKKHQEELEIVEKQFLNLHLQAPNIPDASLPEGGKESNQVVKTVGTVPTFSFPIQNHVTLGQKLGWLDFQMAATMTAGNFALYRGDGVRLIYALGMLMLKNNQKHGYEPVLPPALVNEESLIISGNFPKFRDQVFSVPGDSLFLTPTSEVNMANMYRDHIFKKEELPLRMTAFTSCFRREAGAYGSAERGLIRIHQFEKVELYTICEPHNSMEELDRMVACAESILQILGLHYRISLLAAQDCSFQSAKTYDIEVWLPEQQKFMEVSSASNCTDFQARRGLMRYKKEAAGKTDLVHTLNASSLALPRLMVALMETYQREDGTIALPEVLKKEGIF